MLNLILNKGNSTMKATKAALAISAILSLSAMSASATTIIFDGNNGGVAKSGTVETATADHSGNPNRWGSSLGFTGFNVTGGRSANNNLNSGAFTKSSIIMSNVDQDFNPGNGGLGVCSENPGNCSGSTDSFQSNVLNYATDEVLFFDFNKAVTLDTIWLNGDHSETVAGSTTNKVSSSTNALFNIFYSSNGTTYTNLFANQVRPTNLEFISTGLTSSYQHFAVAASGYGPHASYLEAIKYTSVPEPSTLALFGMGLLALGFARKSKKA
jgi:hypothetical protein